MANLLTLGNHKLGPKIWHFDLPAGPQSGGSCPGASAYCASICYARHGHYLFGSVQAKYAANLAAWEAGDLEHLLAAELGTLKPGTVIRLHTSGDFLSVEYVDMWGRLATAFPALTFYAYTRSWVVRAIKRELDKLRKLPNVTLWASTDATMPAPPRGWPVTRIVDSFADAPTMAHCPEQTGKRANCGECGLCFHPKLRATARLAFKLH